MAFLLNAEEGFCLVVLLVAFCYLLRVESHVIHIREAPYNLEQFPDFPSEFEERNQAESNSSLVELPETGNTTMSEDRAANKTSPSIEDFAISVLLKFKYYPFRKKNIQESRTVGGSQMTMARRMAGNNGVLATGIDFGLPGGLGFGYGEQTPFRTFFSFNRISFATNEG